MASVRSLLPTLDKLADRGAGGRVKPGVERSETLFYDHRRVTDRLVTNLYATSHQQGAQHAIAAFLSGYLNTDTRAPFARLTQRVVLVWGRQDPTMPLDQGESLQELNPRARLEVFDYCGMMPEQEHPEKFNALVRDALAARSVAASESF